ncbi:hypothetical protein GCM10027299_22530 [Larkinella ripae]
MKTDDNKSHDKNFVRNRVLTGIAIFIGWLILFFIGMSVSSAALLPVNNGKIVYWDKLFLYSLTFTPTNTALLAALAGMLGGLASNLSAFNEKENTDVNELERDSFEYRSLIYMTEHPLVSMFRGFLAYLILIAGTYVANFAMPGDNDTAKILSVSPSSYFKFAVTVSLLSYLVGYDPSQLQRLIGSLNVGGKKATDFQGQVRIRDGKTIKEGEFIGKATSSNQAPALSHPDENPVSENGKATLNGEVKISKAAV